MLWSTTRMTMPMMMMVVVVVVVGIAMVTEVRGYPRGAPASACGDMFPQGHKVDAINTVPLPYTLTATPTTIAAGVNVTLTLAATGNATFPYYEGMFVQARRASCDSDEPIGTFTVPANDDFLKLMTCSNRAASSVTHKNATHQTSKTFTWIVPDTYQGRIFFRATVVKNKENFWTNIFSPFVTYANDTSQQPTQYCAVRSTLSSSVPALSASLIMAIFVTSFALIYNNL